MSNQFNMPSQFGMRFNMDDPFIRRNLDAKSRLALLQVLIVIQGHLKRSSGRYHPILLNEAAEALHRWFEAHFFRNHILPFIKRGTHEFRNVVVVPELGLTLRRGVILSQASIPWHRHLNGHTDRGVQAVYSILQGSVLDNVMTLSAGNPRTVSKFVDTGERAYVPEGAWHSVQGTEKVTHTLGVYATDQLENDFEVRNFPGFHPYEPRQAA